MKLIKPILAYIAWIVFAWISVAYISFDFSIVFHDVDDRGAFVMLGPILGRMIFFAIYAITEH